MKAYRFSQIDSELFRGHVVYIILPIAFVLIMKAGVLVSELHKLEGSYFNPRKLSEIATLAFNNGAQV